MIFKTTVPAAMLLVGMLAAPPGVCAAEVEAARLSDIVKTLASDEFEGRAPGTVGEEKTVAYLVEQFKALGLEPGGENGDWTQSVALNLTKMQEPTQLEFSVGDSKLEVRQSADISAETLHATGLLDINSAPVVFVGFGASAPERDWDDYGDMDLTGKVAIFLVNDPDFSAAADEPAAGRFGNRRMTYYGRWAYKFEEAGRRGAIAALVIHEDEAAGYGWGVASSGAGEAYSRVLSPGSPEPVTLQGWLHWDAATKLFAKAGLDLVEQRERARSPDFQAFELKDVTFSAKAAVSVERLDSLNVLALLPGTTRADETLMVSSHWDAYGQGKPDAQGRTVRPGANDDALGTAGVMELARVLKAGPPLQRSVVFAAWTAEESGLLGSASYAANPVYPLEKTVANFTLDILQTAGLARDVILVGEGQSELEDDLARAATMQGRVVTPENLPENGLFFRADHFSLARAGVPVLLIMGIAGGSDLIDGGRAAGDAWIADYIGHCYHQTCDAWSADWNLAGAVQDIELFHTIIRDLGNSTRWPQWKEGSEFKAIRDRSQVIRKPVAERRAQVEKNLRSAVVFSGDKPWTIEERMAHYGVPGASIAVIRDFKIDWYQTYGQADREAGTPVAATTLFQAGSISKPVAAFGAMQMVAAGDLELDENVNETLTSWQLPDNKFTVGNPVTLMHLLSHTGGLTVHGFPGYAGDKALPTLVQVLDGSRPANTDPVRVNKVPGEGYRYSGGGYTIAQQLMADASGRSFPDLMQGLLFGPAGMQRSSYLQPLPPDWLQHAAAGVLPDGKAVAGKRHVYPEMAAAGLWTTAEDLAIFAVEMQDALRGESDLLPAPVARSMVQPVDQGYGLGFNVRGHGDGAYFGHDGWDAGFVASLTAHRDDGYGAVVMINSNHPQFMSEVISGIAHTYGWEGYQVQEAQAMPQDLLNKVVGTYRYDEQRNIKVYAQTGRLFMSYSPEDISEMFYVGDGKFLRRERATPITFIEGESGMTFNFIQGDGSLHTLELLNPGS